MEKLIGRNQLKKLNERFVLSILGQEVFVLGMERE